MRGMACVELEMPVIKLCKVCLYVCCLKCRAFLSLFWWNKLMQIQWIISCFVYFAGIKNVAFFFSAISTQSLKKEQSRKKAHVEDEGSDDADEFPDSSQLGNSTSQEWVASHSTIINQKLCPCVSYWIALTTPNGAPCSPLVIHRALLECSVDVFATQVTTLFQS